MAMSRTSCQPGFYTGLLSFLGRFLADRRVALEDAVGVERFVEVVRGLSLEEPEVPVGDQLVLRQVAQVEILLAQELVPDVGHRSAPRAGSKGSTPSALELTRRWASSSGS